MMGSQCWVQLGIFLYVRGTSKDPARAPLVCGPNFIRRTRGRLRADLSSERGMLTHAGPEGRGGRGTNWSVRDQLVQINRLGGDQLVETVGLGGGFGGINWSTRDQTGRGRVDVPTSPRNNYPKIFDHAQHESEIPIKIISRVISYHSDTTVSPPTIPSPGIFSTVHWSRWWTGSDDFSGIHWSTRGQLVEVGGRGGLALDW